MSFARALLDNPVPAQLAGLKWSYDPPLWVAWVPARRSLRVLGSALEWLSAGLGLLGLATVVSDAPLALAALSLTLCAVSLFAGQRYRALASPRRGFTFNLVDQTLRVDSVSAWRTRTHLFGFDEILAVETLGKSQTREVRLETRRGHQRLLRVGSRVEPHELDQLLRWLRTTLGLPTKSAAVAR